MSAVAEKTHVTLSGDISGDYVIEEELPGGRLLVAPDTSVDAILTRHDERRATPEEFAEFEASHGPFLPPDGEG